MQLARTDFQKARQRAAMQKVMAAVTGQSTDLLSFQEVYEKLGLFGSSERGLQQIPLQAIVGSVGRYQDFSRTFLPRQNSDEQRWVNVKTAVGDRAIDALPPIKVYQIGTAYFVQDGHHRVSIAQQQGESHIHAYVTEVRTKVPLSPDTQPDELIIKSEQAAFLQYTGLDIARPESNLAVTVPGQYSHLEAHIEVQRYFDETAQERDIPWEEAVVNWYDRVYLPIALAVREQGILRHFPGRTETDLYLWIANHQAAIQRELGWQIKPEVAAVNLPDELRSRHRSLVTRVGRKILDAVLPDSLGSGPGTSRWQSEKVVTRYSDRLFADILAPISEAGLNCSALRQALVIAACESARGRENTQGRESTFVHGLLITGGEAAQVADKKQPIQAEFNQMCQTAGVAGQLMVEAGDPIERVQARATLTDLVVLGGAYPQQEEDERLSAACRTIIRRCARPVLMVPANPTSLRRPLLVLKNGDGQHEGLFVAAYMAEQWDLPLTVLTTTSKGRANQKMMTHAQDYLEMHEVAATFVETVGSATAILATAVAHDCDLIIVSGYQASRLKQMIQRSPIDQLLQQTHIPVLICG